MSDRQYGAMPFPDFLNAVIDDGIEDVRLRFTKPDERLRLDGCIDGFEACRGLTAADILAARDAAFERKRQAYREDDPRYWYFLERHGQIEFVLGTVSWLSVVSGGPCLTTIYTSHQMKAMSVLGMEPISIGED